MSPYFHYTSNQVTSTNARGVTATPGYDAAGDMQSDGANTYLYDGEGRVCAVSSTLEPGYTTFTGYLYDADGNRVAKGAITTMSCNPATNGFQFTEDYVTGPGGEELSMLNGSGTWQRTNVYGGGKLIGTYDLVHNPAYTPGGSQPAQVPWLHLHLEDALGTRRMQVSGMLANLAQPEMDFQSLPYGDGFSQLADQYADETDDDSSPLHFTGKERDTESGNDYFDARYYASSMGRWLSPDPGRISRNHLFNPQKWNKYNYVLNNPLTMFDPDGQAEVTIQLRAYIPQATMAGYRGDNRGPTSSQNVTSRTSITVRVETDPSKSANPLLSAPVSTAGQTQRLSDGKTDTQTVGLPTATVSRDANGNVVIHITQDAANPLSPAPQALTPGIKSDLNVTIPTDASSVSVGGTVSGSPAFELNAATGGSQVNLPLQGAPDNPAAFVGGLTQTNQVVNSAPLPPQPPPPTSCATGGTCPK